MQKILLFACTAVLILAASFTSARWTRNTASLQPIASVNDPVSGLDDVINALRSGNAVELGRFIDDNIEITLPDKSDSYSRAQAVMILRDFFNNNGVKGFEVKHKGDNGGSQFCVGTLETRSGGYRTTIFMKTVDKKQLVKEIRFQSM